MIGAFHGMRHAERVVVHDRIRIGTSGWEYGHWRGRFYPRDLSRERWLEFYAARFDTVELNASFYRLPEASTFERWAQRVPDGFKFAVKASRYLTHVRRLRDPEEPLERLQTRARRLGDRLGPTLYQLPPRWRPNPERLERFLAAIAGARDQVIEFRDARWYRPEILAMLERAGASMCVHDMADSATTKPVGPLVYLRFHGAGERYGGSYSTQRLAAWADRIARWVGEGHPVWAYFNNDLDGHAVTDAARLRDFVRRRIG
jgi:uncharacterized protein YecE (DUF72 family)